MQTDLNLHTAMGVVQKLPTAASLIAGHVAGIVIGVQGLETIKEKLPHSPELATLLRQVAARLDASATAIGTV